MKTKNKKEKKSELINAFLEIEHDPYDGERPTKCTMGNGIVEGQEREGVYEIPDPKPAYLYIEGFKKEESIQEKIEKALATSKVKAAMESTMDEDEENFGPEEIDEEGEFFSPHEESYNEEFQAFVKNYFASKKRDSVPDTSASEADTDPVPDTDQDAGPTSPESQEKESTAG